MLTIETTLRRRAARAVRTILLFPVVSVLLGWTGATPLHAMPPVHRIVLPNQLRLIVFEDHSLPIVVFRLLADAGSSRDPDGKEGLANLTARAILLGAGGRSASEINEELDSMGSSLDTSCTKDFAVLSLETLKGRMEKGAALLAATLLQPSFPEDELQKEITRISGEVRSSDDRPTETAEKAFDKALFGSGPYGHSVEGSVESLAGISRQEIAGFHKACYRPNNCILTVGGDVTAEEVQEKIVPLLSAWSPGNIPEVPFTTPLSEKGDTVLIDRDIAQATILFGNPGVDRANPDYYALLVMNHILGGGSFSSRLVEEIRVKRGLAYALASFFSARKHQGAFQVFVQTKNASVREAIALTVEQLRRIRKEPVSQKELETAKKYLIGSFPQRFSTQRELADFLTQVEYFGLGADYPERFPSLIRSVTRQDVLRVAQTYLHPENPVLVVVGNIGKTGL